MPTNALTNFRLPTDYAPNAADFDMPLLRVPAPTGAGATMTR